MKFKKHVTYEIERYPETCAECPAYFETPYQCCNERGWEADCSLGYMTGYDMRDYNSSRLFGCCKIRFDERVHLMHEGL